MTSGLGNDDKAKVRQQFATVLTPFVDRLRAARRPLRGRRLWRGRRAVTDRRCQTCARCASDIFLVGDSSLRHNHRLAANDVSIT